jgi:general secretion pathway protein A
MYKDHFGLERNPFTPLSTLLPPFPSRELEEALAHFQYARQNRESFFLLVGEVGTGKSTAVRAILEALEPQTPVAVVRHTSLDARELLEEVLRRFQLDPLGAGSRPGLLARLEQFLASSPERAPAVLIIDEAHLLSHAALEEVRLLSNLKQEDRPLLQICLVGQPELVDRLRGHRLRPLRQRIGVRYVFGGLTREETRKYVQYRLRAAGAADPLRIFCEAAADAVHDLTDGLPREINVVAGQAMLNAYLENCPLVKPRHVRTTQQDYGFEGASVGRAEPLERCFGPPPAVVETKVEEELPEPELAAEPPGPDWLLRGESPVFFTQPQDSSERARALDVAGAAALLLLALALAYALYPREAFEEQWIPEPPSSSSRLPSTLEGAPLFPPPPLKRSAMGSSPETGSGEGAEVDLPRPEPPEEAPPARTEEVEPRMASVGSVAFTSPAQPPPAALAADRLELGAYLARSGRLDDAIAAFREALALQPRYAAALYNLGISLLEKGRHREAVEALREAASLSPDDGMAQRSLGIALRESGELSAAAAALHRAVELSPNDAFALRHLASVLRESGEVDESIETTRRAVALRPDDASLHHELGFAFHAAGRLLEATTAFQRAIDLDGNLAPAHYGLGVTLLELGNRDAAEREIAEARRLGYDPR